MTYTKTLLAVAGILTAISTHSAQAEDISADNLQIQIAEDIPVIASGERRNVTAIRKAQSPGSADATDGDPRTASPAGAQALMALGIALIVTPSMFGGAFSN